MSLVSRLNSLISTQRSDVAVIQSLPDRVTYAPTNAAEMRAIGNELTIYPEDTGERYVDKGYKRNDAVYSIVSRNAEKCGQVRLYHLTVKRNEVKTALEYQHLTKGAFNDKVVKELAKMRKAMTEDLVVDSKLQKLLNKPTRNQTQSEWIENIVGLRELQGEGNIWMIVPEGEKVKIPTEIPVIPKSQINIIGDSRDPWQVQAYELVLSGHTYRQDDTSKVVMWKYFNPAVVDALSLEHLRGLAPLHAGMILIQGMNEADLRVATSNKNGGASGFVFRKVTGNAEPTKEQKVEMRQQFNNAVNSNEMAGKIAIMAGDWGYHNFAITVKDQQLLEQYGIGFKRLCRMFKTPAGIFDEGNSTYDNQKQFTRNWIYSKIGPVVYSLRDKLSEALLSRFDLDPERNIIDCDISTLPELAEDLKDKVTALQSAHWLSPNEKRAECGYEKLDDENADKIYLPSGVSTLDEINAPVGGGLDDDMKLLGQ